MAGIRCQCTHFTCAISSVSQGGVLPRASLLRFQCLGMRRRCRVSLRPPASSPGSGVRNGEPLCVPRSEEKRVISRTCRLHHASAVNLVPELQYLVNELTLMGNLFRGGTIPSVRMASGTHCCSDRLHRHSRRFPGSIAALRPQHRYAPQEGRSVMWNGRT
eukprot:scaffold142650_cov32-Tisochrysis_lutea.AAC.5